MVGIENVAVIIDSVAEEMDSIAAKLGPDLLVSPTGLLIICGLIFGLAGIFVWNSRKPPKK